MKKWQWIVGFVLIGLLVLSFLGALIEDWNEKKFEECIGRVESLKYGDSGEIAKCYEILGLELKAE
jgi:hypothetical protein